MDVGKLTGAIKVSCLFLLSNITAILFLAGLAFVCYAVFLFSLLLGYVAVGVSLMLVALIINAETDGR